MIATEMLRKEDWKAPMLLCTGFAKAKARKADCYATVHMLPLDCYATVHMLPLGHEQTMASEKMTK